MWSLFTYLLNLFFFNNRNLKPEHKGKAYVFQSCCRVDCCSLTSSSYLSSTQGGENSISKHFLKQTVPQENLGPEFTKPSFVQMSPKHYWKTNVFWKVKSILSHLINLLFYFYFIIFIQPSVRTFT